MAIVNDIYVSGLGRTVEDAMCGGRSDMLNRISIQVSTIQSVSHLEHGLLIIRAVRRISSSRDPPSSVSALKPWCNVQLSSLSPLRRSDLELSFRTMFARNL